MHTTLPTTSDLTTLLGALSPAITLPSGFDLASELSAAVEEWNMRTGYKPFFQTSATATTRAFDPPGPNRSGLARGGETVLLLDNGLVSLTSLYVGVNSATGETGTALTQGYDFWLAPINASSDLAFPRPYTRVEFARPQRGLPQSIVVTGIWGYCRTNIPDPAWKGIRDLALANTMRTFLEGWMAVPGSYREGDVSESFNQGQIAAMGDAFRRSAERMLARFRLH